MRDSSVSGGDGPHSVVGVVGGGQLAQMLVEAATNREVEIVVQTKSCHDPAALTAARLLKSETTDIAGTRKLVCECCAVTFENEWVNIDQLSQLEKEGAIFVPSLAALEPLVDKIAQRQLLDDLGIPGPEWIHLSAKEVSHSELPAGWNFPVMAKSARGGYDGKGTRVLNDLNDLRELFQVVDPNEWLLEGWVQYEMELALVASRDLHGRVRSFPVVQTKQCEQVCDWVIAPAEVSHSVQAMAFNIAASLLAELDYVGVIAIEFFYGAKGLLVNEVAPRTHNSAHFSIEACISSQFDQQLCIAAGLPVPEPEMIVPGALMVNLLGLQEGLVESLEDRLASLKRIDGAHLHWYKKGKEIPGRKLGHVTFLLSEEDADLRRQEAFKRLESIRAIWPNILANRV